MRKEKKLEDLFHDTLKNIFCAERKILKALFKMMRATQSEELKSAFDNTAIRLSKDAETVA